VRRLLSYVEKVKRAPRPLKQPDETALRMQLDRMLAKMNGGRL
jgi:hypothetical protein